MRLMDGSLHKQMDRLGETLQMCWRESHCLMLQPWFLGGSFKNHFTNYRVNDWRARCKLNPGKAQRNSFWGRMHVYYWICSLQCHQTAEY